MKPPRRFADFFALICGALALVAYYGFHADALALAAIVGGGAILIWSLI